ncbi:PEP_CTERM-anchored TLD domain-containing protein [Pirellulaceae bacterium SH467]
MPRLFLLFTFLVLGISFDRPQAQAAFVVGGGGLMTQDYADTIQNWLGNGEIQLTKIYAKQGRESASHFQAAVVGKSRTITLVEILDTQSATAFSPNSPSGKTISLSHQVVGGYNPNVWKFDNIPTYSSGASDKTAFLFNLNSGEKFSQLSSYFGDLQTPNRIDYGPAFGFEDLVIDISLTGGNAKGYAYGLVPSVDDRRSIVMTNESDENLVTGVTGFAIGAIEVYSISSIAAVPEPATMVLWGLGAIGLGAVQKKMRRRVSRDQSRREPSH